MFAPAMTRILLRRSVFVLLFLPSVGCGDPAPPTPNLAVSDVWVRAAAVPEGLTSPVNSAAYLKIENKGEATDRLIGVTFAAAQRVELHESFVDERGIASMRPVDSVEIPPAGEARLEPGGLHVMLFGLDAPLSVGDSVRMALEFEVSGRLTVTAAVRQL